MATSPRYAILTMSAQVPAKWRGIYKRVGIVELEPGFEGKPKMLSERAVGVRRVLRTWEQLRVGKTQRCAYRVAMEEAAAELAKLEEAARSSIGFVDFLQSFEVKPGEIDIG